jgi:hypothetical protein
MREQLLTGARLSEQQHGALGGRDLFHPRKHQPQRLAVADDLVEVMAALEFLVQVDVLGLQLPVQALDLSEAGAQRRFLPMSQQRCGDDLGDEPHALDERVRPIAASAERPDRQRAHHVPADEHGDRQVRLHADLARVGPFVIRLGREVPFDVTKPDDLVAAQPVQVPAQGLRVAGAHRRDAGAGPEMKRPDDLFVLGQLEHGRPVHVERLDQVAERRLDRVGQLVDGNVAEPRRDVGRQALERLEHALDGACGFAGHHDWRDPTASSVQQKGSDHNIS